MLLAPVALFFIPFGLAFGVAASTKGMAATQSMVLSLLAFSGSVQFSTLDLWHATIAYGTLALVVTAVNARHVVMGAALSPWINRLPLRQRLPTLALLNDANFAACQTAFRSGERDMGLLLGSGLVLWAGWVLGAVAGAFAGTSIGDPVALGFDVVMLCFLAAMVAGQANRPLSLVPVLVGAAVAILTLPLLPQGWNVIVGAFAGGIAGSWFHA
ncbi:MAG: AzlC family ABC transporter permease [Rhodobacteraceae bacterium]|nr:AzlC family ABC transporter permease [Paracoccaceae bacterium]